MNIESGSARVGTNPLYLKLIAHFSRQGQCEEAAFERLDDAFEFLSGKHTEGALESADVSTQRGEVILTYASFKEVLELDDGSRRGWFHVLLEALARHG